MLDWMHPTIPARIKPHPWLGQEAINFFELLLRPYMRVLEHGSGGSTLWLAERVEHVTAVEDKETWYNALKKRIPSNVTLLQGVGVVYLAPVDLLFIDGEPVKRRAEWLEAATRLVKPGGYLVLDNANRGEYVEAREKMRQAFTLLHVSDCNAGSTQNLITEFYQL